MQAVQNLGPVYMELGGHFDLLTFSWPVTRHMLPHLVTERESRRLFADIYVPQVAWGN